MTQFRTPDSAASPDATLDLQGYPATLWQERYWRAAHTARDSARLNVAMRWRLDGSISDAAIESAVAGLIARHEILRTRFVEEAGGLRQVVEPSLAAKVAFVDVQRLAGPRQQSEVDRIGREEALTPFALDQAGLLRALLVRAAPDCAVLHLTFHHLILDGWSIGILAREFGLLAAAFDARTPVDLPEIDLHYADYALWQREMLDAGAFAADMAYWRAHLEGLPAFAIAGDLATPVASGAAESFIHSILLDADLFSALEARVRARGETLFALAVAGLASALTAMSGADEVVIGAQTAGRADVDAERIVGPLINTVLLRVPTPPTADIAAVSASAMAAASQALNHQGAPFEALLQAFSPFQGPNPLDYRVNFNLQRAAIDANRADDQRFGRFTMASLPSHSTGAQWDVNAFMVARSEGWRISVEVDAGRYSAAWADQFLSLWRRALAMAAAGDPQPVRSLAPSTEPAAHFARLSISTVADSRRSASVRPSRAAALKPRILPLRDTGDGPAVMALNIASVLYPVCERLGPHYPFYDLRIAPFEAPREMVLRDFADIAREAVDMVRLARPRGPYVLFGLCVAGSLAFETAHQLRAEGEDVALVVLNDSWRPGYREDMGVIDRQQRAWQVRLSRWRRDWGRVRAGQARLGFVLNTYPWARRLRLADAAAAMGLIHPITAEDRGDHEQRWFADWLGAQHARYRTTAYEGPVLLMRSAEAMTGRLFARDMGWGEVVSGPFTVEDCPGAHGTMFRDAGAEIIAGAMKRQLEGL